MKTPSSGRSTSGSSAAIAGVAFGFLGFAVAALSLPETLRAAPFAALSSRLMTREPFREEVLKDFSEKAGRLEQDSWCSIAAIKGVALLSAVLAETALSAGTADIDGRLEALKASASSLLKCSPTQGFGWFALYWTEINQFGPSARALSYLGMSYDTAPREAWIALMRNEAATRVLALASPQVKAAILDEWRDLLKAGLYEDAARTLFRADDARRKELIAATASLDPAVLKWLPIHLNRLGLTIELPNLPEASPNERERYRPFR